MTQHQYEKFELQLSIEKALVDIQAEINNKTNQVGGNSKIGYGVDSMIAFKKELAELITKHIEISKKKREEI